MKVLYVCLTVCLVGCLSVRLSLCFDSSVCLDYCLSVSPRRCVCLSGWLSIHPCSHLSILNDQSLADRFPFIYSIHLIYCCRLTVSVVNVGTPFSLKWGWLKSVFDLVCVYFLLLALTNPLRPINGAYIFLNLTFKAIYGFSGHLVSVDN